MTARPPMITNSTWASVRQRRSSAKFVMGSLGLACPRSSHFFGEFEQPQHGLHPFGRCHALGPLELGAVHPCWEAIQDAVLPGLVRRPPHASSLCTFMALRTRACRIPKRREERFDRFRVILKP